MAINKIIVNEVKDFIRFAVKSGSYPGWSGKALENYQEELIKILLDGIKRCKTDIALCEYAKLISKSKNVELTESIKYWIVLLKI